MNSPLKSASLLLVLVVVFAYGARVRLPARSDLRLSKYWGAQKSILAIKQVGDSVLIQSIGPPYPGSSRTGLTSLLVWPVAGNHDGEHVGAGTPNGKGPSLREGTIPYIEFRAFWDSLGRLGFWRLGNAYRALASRSDEAGGELSVDFETRNHHTMTKAVRFFAPESCSPEFRQVYALFENMAHYAKSVPGWRVLLSYETEEPILGLKDWYHKEALQAIVAARDSQGLDTLLSMLVRDDEYATAIVWGLSNGDSSLAVATLDKLLARLEAASPSADRDSLALHASKILVQLNGRQSVPAVRNYLSTPHDRSLVGDWCMLLASVGDYSVVPDVVEMLSDSSRFRSDYVPKAAGALRQSGYRSRTVISALFRELERELKADDRPDYGIVGALLVALSTLTGEDFKYQIPFSLELDRANLVEWLKWWGGNAKRFPVAPRSDPIDAYGFIEVNSTPSAAAISLDSLSTGNATPSVLPKVPAGKRELWLTKEGYADWSTMVKVTQGETAKVGAILSPIFGSLRVSSVPSGSAITLDGVDASSITPHLLAKVPTGRHNLGLTKDRYVGWDSTVMVTHGQTTIARAMLESPPESLWFTYANSRFLAGGPWLGPERAVKFDPRPEFGYPLHIAKVSARFYFWSIKPWRDSSFRFKIYGSDGKTLLYQSPALEAIPGGPDGPAVVHELDTSVTVNRGEFYVSVAPIDTSGAPSSLSVSRDSDENSPYVFPRSAKTEPIKRSYIGAPGHWTPLLYGELSISVLLRR